MTYYEDKSYPGSINPSYAQSAIQFCLQKDKSINENEDTLKSYPIIHSKKCRNELPKLLSEVKYRDDVSNNVSSAIDNFCQNTFQNLSKNILKTTIDFVQLSNGDNVITPGVSPPSGSTNPISGASKILDSIQNFTFYGAGDSDYLSNPFFDAFKDYGNTFGNSGILGVRLTNVGGVSDQNGSGYIFLNNKSTGQQLQTTGSISYSEFLYNYFSETLNKDNCFENGSNLNFLIKSPRPSGTANVYSFAITGVFKPDQIPTSYYNGEIMRYEITNVKLFPQMNSFTGFNINNEANPSDLTFFTAQRRTVQFDIYAKFKKDTKNTYRDKYTFLYKKIGNNDYVTIYNPIPEFDGYVPLNIIKIKEFFIDLCACHLADESYISFKTIVSKTWNLGLDANYIKKDVTVVDQGKAAGRCLFPGCATSDYPSSEILVPPTGENKGILESACPTQSCFQYFNISGGNAGLTINVSADCEITKTINGKTDGSPEETEENEDTEKRRKAYILGGLGAIVFVLFLSVGLFFVLFYFA